MTSLIGLAMLCGLLCTTVYCEDSQVIRNAGRDVGASPEHETRSQTTGSRLSKRSVDTNHLRQLKRPQRDIYSILDRLPELPHVFGGKRSPVNYGGASGVTKSKSKRSWNAPPILNYIYTRKPFYGTGKRAILGDIAENENAYISVTGELSRGTKEGVSPFGLIPEIDTTVEQGQSNRQRASLASHEFPQEQLPGTFSYNGDNKRSWGAKPMKWNRMGNKPSHGIFGKRLHTAELFEPDPVYENMQGTND